MKIIGYAGSYVAGAALAQKYYPGRYYSVQRYGSGWQKHKWVVMVEDQP